MSQLYLTEECSTHERIEVIFEHYRLVLDHPRARLDVIRRSVISTALSWGYTVDDLQLAIEGVLADPWANGRNDANRKFHGLERIFGKADTIDHYIELGERLRAHLERRLSERRAASSAPAVDSAQPGSSSIARANLEMLREIVRRGARV